MRKIWKFIWVTITSLIALLLLLLLIISQLDVNRFKETIESQVTELTGRQLKIDGDLRLELSLQPLIKIEKVSFANAPWGKQPQMLSVDLLQLKIKLRPLLDHKLIVEQMLFQGVNLSVETNVAGKANWQLDTLSSDEPEESEPFQLPLLPILQHVQLDDIHIYYGDSVENIETDIVLNLQLLHPDFDTDAYLSANGTINQHPFIVSAETRFLTAVTAQNLVDQGIKLKLNANALGVMLTADGVIEQPDSVEGIDIALAIKADNLDKTFTSVTSRSIYQYLPKTKQQMSLDFSARLTDIMGGYDLSAIKLKLADTDLSGDLSYVDQSGHPEIIAKLHSTMVNLNQFLAKQSEKSGQRKGKNQQSKNNNVINLPDESLPFELLKSLDAIVDYRIDQFQYAQFEPEAIKFNAILKKGQLQVKQLDLKLDGAPIRSSLSVDTHTKLPRINTELNIDDFQLSPMAKIVKLDQFKSGKLYSRIKLETRGNSIKALVSDMKGEARIQLSDADLEFQVKDKVHSAEIGLLDLKFFGTKKPLGYDLKGSVDGEPLSLSGMLDSPVSIIDNKRLKLKLKFAAVNVNLKANGSIRKPLNVDDAQLNIAFDIPEPEETVLKISRIVPIIKPNKNIPDQPVKLTGLLTASPKVVRFEKIYLKAGKSDLSGAVIADFRREKPVIDAKLESQLLDLNELVPATMQRSEKERLEENKNKSKKSKLFSTEPLPVLGALDEIDVTIKYKLDKLVSNKQTVDDVDLNLTIKDSRLIIDPLSIEFSLGRVITKLELDSVKKTQLDLDVEVIKLRYDRLMAILGTREYAKGELDAKVKLTGKGESVSELMASLNGSIRLTTVDGELNSDSLKLLSKDLVSVIPFTDNSNRQKINCGVVQFNINNGIADTHSMVINTGAISVLGTGGIDLTNETLSLYVAPRSKRTSLLQVALVPVNVTGSLSSPSIKPDVAGTTINTTKTTANVSLTIATGGLWLLTEGYTNKLWDKFVDDTDYCARALAGDRIVPARIKLEEDDEEDESDLWDDEDDF